MDIERYNYIDIVLRKVRMGTLHDEMKSKAKGSNVDPQSVGQEQDDGADA